MSLTRLALENRTATLVLLSLLFVAGLISFGSLPRAEDPGFVVRTTVVTTFFPGASAEEVELLVTDPIEASIEGIEEVDFVTSDSRRGLSVIEVNFLESLTPEAVEIGFDEVRETVGDIRGQLPTEVVGPSFNDDFGDVFGTIIALTGEGFDRIELERAAERARAVLLRLEAVARVDILGAPEQRLFIEYEPARLAELGLSAPQLAELLRQRNIVRPGGDVRGRSERYELEVSGSFDSPESLAAMRFRLPRSGELISLSDVATVRRGEESPPRTLTHYKGEPVVILTVAKTEDGKITELGPLVLAEMEKIEAQLPIGIESHLVSYQTSFVEKSVENFLGSLLQGVGIVLALTLLALGLRTGFIIAAILPMTMVGSLAFMQIFDISINQMSLAALIISLGLLVDSAIVMAESIQVSIREGKPPVKAAIESAAELRLPLLVSSLTTAAALLPTYLADSTTGEYTSAIFEVVTIALLLAWVLALTMTPLLIVLANRKSVGRDDAGPRASPKEDDAYDSRFYRFYQSSLLTLVRWRWVSLTAFVALLAVSLWAFQFVPQLFFPRADKTTFTVQLELPEGSSFERLEEVVKDIERYMAEDLGAEFDSEETRPWLPYVERNFSRDGVVNWATFLGSGAPRFILGYTPEQPRPNYAYMVANSSKNEVQDDLIEKIEGYVRRTHPEVLPRVEKLRNGPPLDYPVEIRLSGEDPGLLYDLARDVERRLREIPGTYNVGHDWDLYSKKIRVEVDDARARRAGLTELEIASSLQTATSGTVLTQYREGNDLIPVVMRSKAAAADAITQLQSQRVLNSAGQSVPLEQVARLGVELEPGKILRRDRQRTLTVQADIHPSADRSITPFSVAAAAVPLLEEAKAGWPLGYDYEFGGEVESSGKAQASIQAKQPIAVLVIVALLVLQFNSLRGPLIVFATLPFTLIGVVGGLLVTQKPFGFMALLGVIALFGVVINNAVVLLDRIGTEINKYQRPAAQAVIVASTRRLRPILLTTATTVGGLIPLWLAGGPMFSPMAVAFLSGLVASTLLTLGLVPVLYGILYRVKVKGLTLDDVKVGAMAGAETAPGEASG